MADVKLSHPDKVLFPADGITKAGLAGYYAAVAPAMVPHTRDRPLNLWRWNNGIDRDVVVQQAIPKGAPEWVRARRGAAATRRRPSPTRWPTTPTRCAGSPRSTASRRTCGRAAPTGSTGRTGMIFDLDPPDEGADFAHIREGALAIGELLRELGREPYAMTSGSRGIHVLAPLRRTAVHDVVREQAREIAEELAARHPAA